VDQFKGTLHHELMEQSWILVNPAIREGLPNSFLEAAAHQTAILSYVNPDNFASEYGFHAFHNNFEEGLIHLMESDQWKKKALKGYENVKETFSLKNALDQHEEVYHQLFLR
jgi:glycosyltransferase involved in cell wall biosynthesis